MKKLLLGFALASAALTGCSTTMHGTAPAKEGFVYAAGSKVKPFMGEQPEVWLCPVPKKGQCQLISVHTQED